MVTKMLPTFQVHELARDWLAFHTRRRSIHSFEFVQRVASKSTVLSESQESANVQPPTSPHHHPHSPHAQHFNFHAASTRWNERTLEFCRAFGVTKCSTIPSDQPQPHSKSPSRPPQPPPPSPSMPQPMENQTASCSSQPHLSPMMIAQRDGSNIIGSTEDDARPASPLHHECLRDAHVLPPPRQRPSTVRTITYMHVSR
jgi:hypothetical protein